MVLKEFRRFAVGSLLGVLLVFLLLFNALVLWVATGPRLLTTLTPFIEGALSASDGSYAVSIGETWLIWDGWRHPIDIRVRDVRVLTREGRTFSKFPEISLGIDLLSLPLGQVLPTSLTIKKPVISLLQGPDRSISFGFENEDNTDASPTVSLAAIIAPMLSSDGAGRLRKLRHVAIHNADVSIGNPQKGVFFKLAQMRFDARRNWKGELEMIADAKMIYEENQSPLRARLLMGKNLPGIEGRLEFSGVMPGVLISLFIDNSYASALNLPVSGEAGVSFGKDGQLASLKFNVDGGIGSIDTKHLAASLPVDVMHIQGEIRNGGTAITVENFSLVSKGMSIGGYATASMADDDVSIRADMKLENGRAESVNLFWPPELSPMSREWVTENITEGIIPHAQAHIDIKPGDLSKPILPREAVNASISLEGAKIRYLPEHPHVSEVKGTLHIDGISLTANIESASYLKESKISSGKMMIGDLNADNPYITITLDATASARDAVEFLKLPRLGQANRLNLKSDEIKGSGTVHADLGFHFFAPTDEAGNPVGEGDISYDVKASLHDISQQGFMKKFDIEGATGELTVDAKKLTFKGRGSVNGAKVEQTEVSYLFHPENGFDTLIDVTAQAPIEALPRFGYPAFPFIKGTLGVKADVKLGEEKEFSQAAIDLTNADVTLDMITWKKSDKEQALLDITAVKESGAVSIPKFHLTGEGVDAAGSAALDKTLSEIQSVSTTKFVVGNTNLSNFDYEKNNTGYRIHAKGKSADLSGYMDSEDEDGFSFEHFPAVQVTLDIDRLILSKNGEIGQVKGALTCTAKLCSSASIGGMVGDKKEISFRILRNPKGQRQVSLHAKDAGAFLKAVNIMDGMEDGELMLTGNFEEKGDRSKLDGRVIITEYRVKDTPILARILSLASFTGVIDGLQGNGIRFAKMSAPFTLENDIITLVEAKTYGSAVGLTADGTITFPQKALDIQGTVVPAYALNNVVGKVPLIGTLLTGKEGQGVFAARYSVKGTEEKPDVTVNPLSMLTPGFLRGLFDVLDKPKAQPAENE